MGVLYLLLNTIFLNMYTLVDTSKCAQFSLIYTYIHTSVKIIQNGRDLITKISKKFIQDSQDFAQNIFYMVPYKSWISSSNKCPRAIADILGL